MIWNAVSNVIGLTTIKMSGVVAQRVMSKVRGGRLKIHEVGVALFPIQRAIYLERLKENHFMSWSPVESVCNLRSTA